ncbi:unnamed protein product [Oikopleura dioica]|uniref:Small monomeric GTPase n=1 Tax=Oikopleura dioica TaxID=34765 RepID=E4XU92_OIKDI|nr:unnamed protein product [Oikopleura dioica]
MSKAEKLRLVLFGEGGVGKSAITIRYFQRTFAEYYDPTIEDSYTKWCSTSSGARVFLEVTDTAGQESFEAIRDHYIQNGDGFMLCYSATCDKSFDRLDNFKDHIQRVKNSTKVPIMICANKIDLKADRVVSQEQGLEYAKKVDPESSEKFAKDKYIETSAKTGERVDEAFQKLLDMTYRHLNGNPEPKSPITCCTIS